MKTYTLVVVCLLAWCVPEGVAQVDEVRPAAIAQDAEGVPFLWAFGDLDQPPSCVFDPSAVFPYALRNGDVSTGSAVLRFTVGRSGEVRDLRIVSASHREFGLSAYQAHYKAMYRPAKKNGTIVECEVERLFRFSFAEEEEKTAQPGATDNPGDAQ